jgi:crossover junction endodeoxyribonuclease RuvC
VRVFGIDPGSHRTGWGAVELAGSTVLVHGFDVIRADGDAPLSTRLDTVHRGLERALDDVRPTQVFLESIFHHKSAKSALVLGHARGVALLAAARSGADVRELSPAEVKKSVTGNGRAEKEQVQEMVRIILGMATRAPADASDALALAIAGAYALRSPIRAVALARKGTR